MNQICTIFAGLLLSVLLGGLSWSDVIADRRSELGKVNRDLLVLYGNDAKELLSDMGWPRDTGAARMLQTPLEWMGYELRYHNVLKKGALDSRELVRYGGLIVDGSLHVPEGIEAEVLSMIESARSEGIPLLFFGPYPFSSPDIRLKVARLLGLQADGSLLRSPQTTGIVSLDHEMMGFEAEVRPRNTTTHRLQAPLGSQVFLSVIARSSSGEFARFDPVFLTEWGGVILEPYVEFRPSSKQTLLLVDLYKYLAQIWPVGSFPAPDPTTRDGLRVFLSHIDGDGFASLSHLRGGATCGEIVLERILKKYPFPVTVSVVEANLRGLEKGQRPDCASQLESVAKKIFALPYAEAATHTFSHPFVWLDGDVPYEEQYETRNLQLNPDIVYPAIDFEREIGGSAAYVQSLLPEGKKVELVLWSGNCQPGAEALRIAAAHGLGNMNGGDTIISSRYPGIAGVAPRLMYWDDQIQVLAPNQNDFVYTQDWGGQSLTGFTEVLETYALTELPRRLKPVNVYYHFYSGALVGPLSALDRVYRWCLTQPLHPVNVSRFAKITLDSHATQIYRDGERRWRLKNKGHLRTFRLPVTAGVPLIAASSGVTGYCRTGDWHYIHTDGRTETLLQLGDPGEEGTHLFLEQTTGEIVVEMLSSQHSSFRQFGYGDIRTIFGGAEPDADYLLKVGEEWSVLRANTKGQLHLTLPGNCVVSLARKEE